LICISCKDVNGKLYTYLFKKQPYLLFEFGTPPLLPNGAPLLKDAEFAITWKKVVTSQRWRIPQLKKN